MGIETIEFTEVSDGATRPRRGTENSAGIDLAANKPFGIAPGQRWLVSTGLAVKLPRGTYGKLEPRSGLAAKFGIDPVSWFLEDTEKSVLAGVVDCDYRGELKIVLRNTGDKYAMFKAGEFIAQMIVRDYVEAEVAMVSTLSESTRDGGFGHTDD